MAIFCFKLFPIAPDMSAASFVSNPPPFLPWNLGIHVDAYMEQLKKEDEAEYKEIRRMTQLFVRAMLERRTARKHAHQTGGSVVCASKLYAKAAHIEIMEMQGDYKDCINDMVSTWQFVIIIIVDLPTHRSWFTTLYLARRALCSKSTVFRTLKQADRQPSLSLTSINRCTFSNQQVWQARFFWTIWQWST